MPALFPPACPQEQPCGAAFWVAAVPGDVHILPRPPVVAPSNSTAASSSSSFGAAAAAPAQGGSDPAFSATFQVPSGFLGTFPNALIGCPEQLAGAEFQAIARASGSGAVGVRALCCAR